MRGHSARPVPAQFSGAIPIASYVSATGSVLPRCLSAGIGIMAGGDRRASAGAPPRPGAAVCSVQDGHKRLAHQHISGRGARRPETQKISDRLTSDDVSQDRPDIGRYMDAADKHGKNACAVLCGPLTGNPGRRNAPPFAP